MWGAFLFPIARMWHGFCQRMWLYTYNSIGTYARVMMNALKKHLERRIFRAALTLNIASTS